MTDRELFDAVAAAALLRGDFTLRSGRKSKYYLDKYLFETKPDVLKALGKEFARHMTDDVTLIAGAELGGVALAVSAGLTVTDLDDSLFVHPTLSESLAEAAD